VAAIVLWSSLIAALLAPLLKLFEDRLRGRFRPDDRHCRRRHRTDRLTLWSLAWGTFHSLGIFVVVAQDLHLLGEDPEAGDDVGLDGEDRVGVIYPRLQ